MSVRHQVFSMKKHDWDEALKFKFQIFAADE